MSLFSNLFDERFVLHRLKATRFAAVVTAVAMAAYYYYELIKTDTIRYDLLVLLGIMVVAKLGATIYYRLTN